MCISLEVLLEFLHGGLILAMKYLLPLGKRAKSGADWVFGRVAELCRGLGTVISDSVGLGGSLRICISDTFPGGARNAAVPGRPLRTTVLDGVKE